MNVITAKIGGTEKTLDAWGLNAPLLSLQRRKPSTLTTPSAGTDPAAAPAIPYGTNVIFYADRVGAGTSWSGGRIIFQGKRRKFRGSAKTARGVVYVFEDAFGALARVTYQQTWNLQAGAAPVARVFLFQKIGATSGDGWSYWKTFEQAKDIIDYAASCGVAIQSGTIDGIMPQPVTPLRAPSCAQALSICLEAQPSMASYFDYTTTPPTLNLISRQNCTPITLPYKDGIIHDTTEIESRDDQIVNQVVIQYQQTNDVGGVIWSNWPVDAYPIGSTGQAEQCCVAAVDLRGASSKIASGVLNAAAFDPSTAAFWSDKIKALGDATVSDLAVIDNEVKDTTGSAIDLSTYPRELKRGTVAGWMVDGSNNPIKVIEAIVTAHVSYNKHDANATSQVRHKIENHAVSTRVRLTNSPAGDKPYTALASSDQAESAPPNLAYLFWCDCNNAPINAPAGVVTPPDPAPSITGPSNLQWEGTHVIRYPATADNPQGNILDLTITPGNVLNLDDSTGGNPDWAEMNATIESVDYDFANGMVTIKFSPAYGQTLEQFLSQMMMFRMRQMADNINMRSGGQDSAGAGTDIGADGRLEDSNVGPPADASKHTVATRPAPAPPSGEETPALAEGDQFIIESDANEQQFLMAIVDNTGAIDDTKSTVNININGLFDDDGTTPLAFEIRRVTEMVSDGEGGCVAHHRFIIASQLIDGE